MSGNLFFDKSRLKYLGKNVIIGKTVKMGNYSTLSSHVSVHCASSDYTKTSLDLPSVPKDQQYGGFVEDVEVGNYVVIGSHSVILPGVKLPDKLACGAFTLLDKKDYEELGLYVGVPSRFLKRRINVFSSDR